MVPFPAAEQPYGVTTHTADGAIVQQMVIPKAGTVVPQHSHAYEHLTMLAVGSLLIEAPGRPPETVAAPDGVTIPAGVKHRLTSLEDHTVAYCIHNSSRSGSIEVAEEHCIVGCHNAPGAA